MSANWRDPTNEDEFVQRILDETIVGPPADLGGIPRSGRLRRNTETRPRRNNDLGGNVSEGLPPRSSSSTSLLGREVDLGRYERLEQWDGDLEFVGRLLPMLGAPPAWERAAAFPCVLPEHPGGARTARVFRDERRGIFLYFCEHFDKALALGQVYASVKARRFLRPNGSALARWKVRALVDAGFAALGPPVLPPLPTDRRWTRNERDVYEAIDLLFRVRELAVKHGFGNGGPQGDAAPLARSFLVDWSGGIPPSTVQGAKRKLDRAALIVPDGEYQPARGYRMKLWRPGDGRADQAQHDPASGGGGQ